MLDASLVKINFDSASEISSWIRQNIDEKKFCIIPANNLCRTKDDFNTLCLEVGELLGDLVVQNAAGDRVIEVYDRRVGTIENGARYHQTRQGGDIHIDSVNRLAPFRYLILGCVAPASVGGESILVRADDVYKALLAFPKILPVLMEPFWFEERGMNADSDDHLFQMPILTLDGDRPIFRYLRSYIESAHRKANQPLDERQISAFDVLDAILQTSSLQYRRNLQQGEILVTSDVEVFHGRTGFVDLGESVGWSDVRKMLRIWIS